MILQYVLMQFSFYQQIRETTPNAISFSVQTSKSTQPRTKKGFRLPEICELLMYPMKQS